MLFKEGACLEGKWGAMAMPWAHPALALGAKPGKEMQSEKRHRLHDMHVAYGRTQVAHRRAQGNAQACARQRTQAGQGSAPTTHRRVQAALGSALKLCVGSIQAVHTD